MKSPGVIHIRAFLFPNFDTNFNPEMGLPINGSLL